MDRPYTIVQLRYFCAVARAGSMTRAADDLSVAQSTLSAAVTQLEGAMGVRLFERSPRRTLTLSTAGRRLLAEALALLEQVDGLPQVARGSAPEVSGELVVGIFGPIASFRAARLLMAFARTHPRVELRYLEGDQEEVRQALVAGRCDVALMYDLGLGDGFATSTVERIIPHVLVAADHRLASSAAPVHLADLVTEPLVLLDLPHSRDYYLGLFAGLGLSPTIGFRLPGYEAVRSFVACGHGYTLLNQRLPHSSTHAGLDVVRVPIADDLRPISVVVAYPPKARPTRTALGFEDVCRALYRSEPDLGS